MKKELRGAGRRRKSFFHKHLNGKSHAMSWRKFHAISSPHKNFKVFFYDLRCFLVYLEVTLGIDVRNFRMVRNGFLKYFWDINKISSIKIIKVQNHFWLHEIFLLYKLTKFFPLFIYSLCSFSFRFIANVSSERHKLKHFITTYMTKLKAIH